MTAKELLKQQVDDAGFQLEKALEGIDENTLDQRITMQSMTPREIIAHLAECYYAAGEIAAGREHNWGTYKVANTSWPAIWQDAKALRATSVDAVLESPNGESNANSHIVAHDYYHVGQLCLARLAANPEWNAYSIYPG